MQISNAYVHNPVKLRVRWKALYLDILKKAKRVSQDNGQRICAINCLSINYLKFKSCIIQIFLLLFTKSCLTCDPMVCSLPGSSVHGILQARILEWVAISFSRGSSWPRDQTCIPCIGSDSLPLSYLVPIHQAKIRNF